MRFQAPARRAVTVLSFQVPDDETVPWMVVYFDTSDSKVHAAAGAERKFVVHSI